jgi:hypothetical protein
MKNIQETFDTVQRLKSDLTKLQKDRKESLILESESYESLSKEIDEKSNTRKKIELDFDEAHPTLREKLDGLSESLSEASDTLTHLIISALVRGEKVEIVQTRNGKKKRFQPKFKVGFERQQRMI